MKSGFTKLFLAALLPGVMVAVLLSLVLYFSERDDVEQTSLQTARALLRAVDAELARYEAIGVALSTSDALRRRDLAQFDARLHLLAERLGNGIVFALIDPSGQELLNTGSVPGAPLPPHGNLDGVRRVVETRKSLVSDLYTGPLLKRPVISIEVPVIESGQVVYVLDVHMFPEHLNQLLADQKLPEGSYAAVLDSRDTVVARNINPSGSVGRRATDDLRAQIARQPSGTMLSHSLEGEATFIAYEKSARTGWTISVGMARHIVYRTLYWLLGMVALSWLVFVSLGALLSWLVSRHVRHSVNALRSVAHAATRGETGVTAPTSSGIAELDALARQFNEMQEARRVAESQIRELAFHDPLTLLPNRRLLLDRVEHCLARNRRGGTHGALVFLDLDNFKTLNDEHGHAAGDLLLIEVAARLSRIVRKLDTVSRFGGDEFVVLIVDLPGDAVQARAAALQVAEHIRARLAEPYVLVMRAEGDTGAPDIRHHCTASIGVKLFDGDNLDADAILEQADGAMYEAKRAGRNQVQVAA